MQKSTSSKSKNRRVLTLAGITILAFGAIAALMASGFDPAVARSLAQQPDTQVAVFLVPVGILMLALMIEAVRFVVHGSLPARVAVPKRPARRTNWADSDR